MNFTYFEWDPSLNGRAFERFARVNDPAADQKYNSVDFALSKRLSQNWQLTASYSATKRNVPFIYTDLTAPATTASGEFNGNVESAPVNPNNEINTADKEWEYTWKLSGVYSAAVRHPDFSQLRGAQRLSLGASGAIHRRRDDSEHHDERRADRHESAADQPSARRALREDVQPWPKGRSWPCARTSSTS